MNSELLQIIEFLEQEKEVSRETLFTIVEDALCNVIKKEYPTNDTINVKMNKIDGQLSASAQFVAVNCVTNSNTEKTLEEIKKSVPDAKVNQTYTIWLPTQKIFSRIGAQAVKQAIAQKLREVEKNRIQREYADKIGKLITGTVRSFDRGNTYIDFGRAEGVMPFNEKIKSEEYQNGDLITTVLLDVNELRAGANLKVSRAHPDLVRLLFEREVTEIADGTVIVKALSREAGFRTKIAVHSNNPNVDSVGACVGIRGTRVRAIMRELGREKIDIIKWSDDIETFVEEALQPAEVLSTKKDEKTKTIIVHTNKDQYPIAIGYRGQNSRLVSQLTSWDIRIIEVKSSKDDSMESKMQNVVELFSSIPQLDKELSEELISLGYLSLDGLSEADPADLANIEGIDETMATQVINYAKNKLK